MYRDQLYLLAPLLCLFEQTDSMSAILLYWTMRCATKSCTTI